MDTRSGILRASNAKYASVPVESTVKVWSIRMPISSPGIGRPFIRWVLIIFSMSDFATDITLQSVRSDHL